jgi:hypothetical protein
MAEKAAPKQATPPEGAAVTDDNAAQVAGTNEYGIDLNDQRLKAGSDNPDAQARNEAEMNAAAGTDRPVAEQIGNPNRSDEERADAVAAAKSEAAPDKPASDTTK